MQAPILHKLYSQNLWLSAQRSLFWEEEKALVVSDLHFGKTGHFRKAGIAVPQSVYKEDLQRLVSLLNHFRPQKLIVVGDFFHSSANTELDWFKRWRESFSSLQIILVRGNHDILNDQWYAGAAIDVVYPTLQSGPFLFSHDQCDVNGPLYSFCGHIHPGVVIHGLGKQSLRFPCFYFAEEHCILPAFSKFTGAVGMDKSPAQAIYAVVENELVKIK
ncbi:ligase-associated DNA damage response endonuclease PdeM [Flavisolibacter ginsenosidimutans]|uniref:Ligase-associated DNA damage response endonuclease PdeM n=1 Tax=Flavisolibacter ginsenosidimutans TaxID=661481 RepID=A0A5B8UPA6_9BACT|nr:ligase-associated DNA damage response endonuclease PdeM [Flavisolibacter ginsenosidimutans]QEC58069.1 ligase-associated DNA damage response endonuclease PdeM [Flavisolibacter ginsenosidimutans]